MTHEQLKNRVSVSNVIQGHFKVTILFRDKLYTSTSTNTLAYDKLNCELIEPKRYYATSKQAYQSLFDEVKRKHELK